MHWAIRSSRMEFQDRTLKCIDCGADFVFTAGEQLFFHDKQFKHEPKRCKTCKTKRLTSVGAVPVKQGLPMRQQVETSAVCGRRGNEAAVPFRPTQGRPVLCRERFRARGRGAQARL